VLRQNGLFEDWPLETIIPDAQAFFAFLQERWPVFLDRFAAEVCGVESDVRDPKTHFAPKSVRN
jgi:hypothetical protein